MKINRKQNNNGFTLIETIIYVAIIGIAMSSFISFGISISTSRSKTYAIQEVQANARMLMGTVVQKIKHAQGVNSPIPGNSNDIMVLDMPNAEPDITFSIIDGIVYMTEGVGDPFALVSNRVEVTNIIYNNVGEAGGADSVQIGFDMQFRNAASVEFSYTGNFNTAITTRY